MPLFDKPKVISVDVSKKDPRQIMANARQLAEKEGITIRGNDRQGSVTGTNVDGDYLVTDSSIQITLRETPSVPWFLVKWMITGFINGKG